MKFFKTTLQEVIIVTRRFIYTLLGIVNSLLHLRRPAVVVYCYHSIANDKWRFTVSLENIKKQIDSALQCAQSLSGEELYQYLNGKLIIDSPRFLVTFDDGYRDIITTVDYFREKNVKPIVFVLSRPENANRTEMETNKELLSYENVRHLAHCGWDIGCHSATHADFSRLSADDIRCEITDAKRDIEKNIGLPVKYFAYPKGQYTREIVDEVRNSGFQLGFTVEHNLLDYSSNKYLLPRVGVDYTHSLREFSVMSSVLGISLKQKIVKLFGIL